MSTLLSNTIGQADLRAETISKIVRGIALQTYNLKQLCAVSSSNVWMESYFKEDNTNLSVAGATPGSTPRLAKPPQLHVNWTKVETYPNKYIFDEVISWEDEHLNNIDAISRTLLRITKTVMKAVDDAIWDTLTESRSVSTINSVTISAGNEWDSGVESNRDPITNIMRAVQAIQEYNYEPDTLVLSPKDHTSLVSNPNIRNVANFWTDSPTKSGALKSICGLKVLVSNSVTADYALVCQSKTCATWKETHALSTSVENDMGVKKVIRVWEMGMAQLVNPRACCLIINTQA